MPGTSNADARYYLGYDPGGSAGNGVALVAIEPGARVGTSSIVGSVDDALDWFAEQLNGKEPVALGIDAYLFWETGRGGWRAADHWLRRQYAPVRGSVFCSNSAAGSMAVQGMALAIAARQRWPTIMLVESHPKVLYYCLTSKKYDWPSEMKEWLARETGADLDRSVGTEHEWDALLCAWAAHQGSRKVWRKNLRTLSNAVIEPAGPVSYWWPD